MAKPRDPTEAEIDRSIEALPPDDRDGERELENIRAARRHNEDVERDERGLALVDDLVRPV